MRNIFVFYFHKLVFIVIDSVIIVFIMIFYTMMMTFLSFCWIYIRILWIFSINHLIFIMIILKPLLSIPLALFLRLLSLKMFLFTTTSHTKLMINRLAWLIVLLPLFLRYIRMIWHYIIHLTARSHWRQINIWRIFSLIISLIIIITIIRIIVLILMIITPFFIPSIYYIRQRNMLLFFYIFFMCLIFINCLLLNIKR